MRRKGRKGGEDAAILPRGYEKSHAKPRQEPRPGRGRYGVEPLRTQKMEREIGEVRKCEGENVGKWF